MPAASARDTLFRQSRLLSYIPRAPRSITVADLLSRLEGEGFEVTRRTVERDLQKLSVMAPLQLDDDGDLHRWSISADGRVSITPTTQTVADALTLVMVRDYLGQLLPPSLMNILQPTFERADTVIAVTHGTNRLARWRKKVRSALPTQPLIAPDIPREVQVTAGEALFKERQFAVTYWSRSGQHEQRLVLNPVAMLQRGLVSYILATCPPHNDVRMFAMHRMRDAELLRTKAAPVDGFDLDEFLAGGFADFGHGRSTRLVLHAAASVADHLRECRLSEDQTMEAVDGQPTWWRITATVADTPQLRWWLRGFGESVRVEAGLDAL